MKKAIAAIGLLAVALAGLVFLLPLAFGSDTLRTALSDQLSEASGADISFSGPIRFSIVPNFGIVAENVSYVSGDGSVSATSERSVASVNLMSLLSDQIRITGIELRNPRIVLADTTPGEAGAESASSAGEDGDVFKLAAAYLQRLSFDRIQIADGEIAQKRGGTARSVASGINLRLSVPGIREPASLAFSGTVDGRKVELAADIGSLRDLLDRQPTEFSLSATTERPPHPALADVSASGSIQLADNGSYRITGGNIDSAGQKMQLDASYVPGNRPFVTARIAAGTLDYSDLRPAETATPDQGSKGDSASDGGLDFSALRVFDADIELRAEAMRAGDAIARDIVVQAKLQNGRLNSTLNSKQIAGGGLAASMLMDVNSDVPEIGGSLNLTSIDIQRLLALAGRQPRATGQLSSQLQYAFLGTDVETIRDSINVGGVVSVRDGVIDIPQLAELTTATGRVEVLDLTAETADISKPLAVSGTANWNGETFGFVTSIVLTDLLSGQRSATSVDFKSRPINAKFSGTVAPDGSMTGRTDIAADSLSRALGWFGRDIGTPLGRFSYSGRIAAGGSRLALSDAAIVLDDIHANGSVSVDMSVKTTIAAALSVDALDFEKLTGGAGGAAADTSAPTAIDLSALRQLDADIRLDANRIGYGSVKAGPAKATLTIKGGVARLVVPEAGFYDGMVTADVTANSAGETPVIEFAARLDKVSALPLLTDAAGFQRIEGRVTAEVAVNGSGGDSAAFTRTLNGKAGVVFSDGALRGIDVARLVNNLQSLIRTGYKEEAGGKTEFTELSVSLDIKDGIARTGDLRLLGPFVRMSGEGSIDFTSQMIDMRLDPRVVGSLNGQGGDFDVSGLGMPIIVAGPLVGPRIYPDISGILANPQQALQTLSRLGGSVGELATGVSGAADLLKDKIGVDPGSAADGVVSELINRLGDRQARNGANTPVNTRDLVGSLLQNLGGSRAHQPDLQAALPPEQQVTQPAVTPPGTDTWLPGATLQEDGGVVLPTKNIPIPTPNPHRMATADPVLTPEPTSQAPDVQRTLTDEAVDAVLPQIVPEGGENAAPELIKDLIKQIGR